MRVKGSQSFNSSETAALLSRCTSSSAALGQHVKIELALADVASVVVDTLHCQPTTVRPRHQASKLVGVIY
uniref:Uncharacterized protein n=1 Tax=Arundo donax TaxID=35708 RepID=A0A0A9DB81_ARUDO